MAEPVAKPKKSKRNLDSSNDGSVDSATSAQNGSQTSNNQLIAVQVDSTEAHKKEKKAKSSSSKPDEKHKTKDKERRKLKTEGSVSGTTTPVVAQTEPTILHEGVVYKHAGRFKGWKKRTLKLKSNGDLEYYHKNRLRGTYSVLSSVIVLSRSDPCRCEIDTGRDILHLRTLRASDRDVWVEKVSQIQKPDGKSINDTLVSQFEVRLNNINKNISLARSLESVLGSRIDMMKSEKTPHNAELVTSSADTAPTIVHDSSHHKKKKHSRTKSEDVGQHGITFVQQASEIHRSIANILSSLDGLHKDFSDAIANLDNLTSQKMDSLASPAASRSKVMSSSSSVGADEDAQLMILYDDDSNSDSEDYFDALLDSNEIDNDEEDEDSSSSSAEYFDLKPATAASTKPVEKHVTITTEIVPEIPAAATASSSRQGTPSKKDKKASKKASKRLSRNFKLESAHSSLVHIPITTSTLHVNETLSKIPSDWKPRAALPYDKPKGGNLSLMKILKDAIGKDITRVTIPVQFSEPINMLQRLVEDFEYGELLMLASEEPDVVMRLLYVAAFAASSYASIYVRRTKPFNPLLGETFEYVDREKQFRLLTEQVSHHPPISAFTADSPGYTMWGHAHAKTKFWGKSLEITPTGSISLRLFKWNETYTWNKITTSMNNVLVGTKWIDNYGDLSVYNQTTGHKVLMDFKKRGWFDAHAYEVVGSAYDPEDNVTHRIEGFWNDYLAAHPTNSDGTDNGTVLQLWKRIPLPDHAEKQYNFTSYAMTLNEHAEWMKEFLPKSDSRLRPDQRALENCEIDVAQSEKSRLEDKQRAARKKLEEAKQEYTPVWFSKGESDTWQYNGGYWEARHSGKWPENIPDLF